MTPKTNEKIKIDEKFFLNLILENTKVIIPVNLYGQKFNLKKLREIVNKHLSKRIH